MVTVDVCTAKRCSEPPRELTDQMKLLTIDFTWFALGCMDDTNRKDVTRLLIEVMLNYLNIAETMLAVLKEPSEVSATLLIEQAEKTIARLCKG